MKRQRKQIKSLIPSKTERDAFVSITKYRKNKLGRWEKLAEWIHPDEIARRPDLYEAQP